MFGKVVRIIDVLRDPRAWRGLASWKPFSIASYTLLSELHRRLPDFRTIIDAGANVGQFARASAEIYPDADVYSVEALPSVARVFRANLLDKKKVQLFETALGNYDGTITFHPHAYSQSSSALLVRPEHESKHDNPRLLPPIEVPIVRLDTLLSDKPLTKPILLKLDLQGYELEALKGGRELLAQCDCVLVETVFEEAYAGEPLFEEILGFLQSVGFRFACPLAFLKDSQGAIYQMDALFTRKK